jgi:hypothetical protein
MARQDWMVVGMKLLGVYIGIEGAAALWQTVLILMKVGTHGQSLGGMAILAPAVHLAAAYFLVCRTKQCLQWCGEGQGGGGSGGAAS